MFGHKHYMPVLRLKRAELRALRKFAPALRPWTTPLLECPPAVLRNCQTQEAVEKKLATSAKFLSVWTGRAMFIDFSMLRGTNSHPVIVMADHLERNGIRPVPVVSLKDGPESVYGRALHSVVDRSASLCLRVSPEELRSASIGELVEACIGRYGMSASQVHLVVDRGGVDSSSLTFEEFAWRIPLIDSWQTLTLLAGSFPEDLSRLAPRETHRLRRFEWRQWQKLDSWSGRRPAFGDYTVQHVFIKESVPVPNISASIRYTIEDEFYVLRGEGIDNEGGPGRAQWNAQAALLRDSTEYFGASFSAGDRYIDEMASDWDHSGSPVTWLEAAFSHHVTATALQVAGRLEQVREVAASAADWTSIVNIEAPGATL